MDFDSNTLLQLGVGGAVAVIIIGMVLNFLKSARLGKAIKEVDHSGFNGSTAQVLSDLHGIRTVLEARDSDGTPLVYVPRSLAEAIHEQAESTREQNRLLNQLVTQLIEARKDIDELRRVRH